MDLLSGLKKGGSRLTFEAEKLVRLNRVQSETSALRAQIRERTLLLGQQALDLHKKEGILEEDLKKHCEEISRLERQLAENEEAIERIRGQRPGFVTTRATYGHICPKCMVGLPQEAIFCPDCGGAAVDVPSPAVAGPRCSFCGSDAPLGAAFCATCGHKIVATTEVANSTFGNSEEGRQAQVAGQVGGQGPLHRHQAKKCASCSAMAPEEASFCPECGGPLEGG